MPYKDLGERIKFLREQWKQTISELSSTLEIDVNILNSIEQGNLMPSDEQLEMLISHFLLTEDQAEDLLELADIYRHKNKSSIMNGVSEDTIAKQIMMMFMPVDSKVIYNDSMTATVDEKGVILQFMQKTPDGQNIPVSRVGMSHDHAVEVARVITNTLEQYFKTKKQNKKLPPKSDSIN